jgi:hypothetical protein
MRLTLEMVRVHNCSVVNRPVRPELGRNGAVFFETRRGRTEGTAVLARVLARWLLWRLAYGCGHEAGGLRPPWAATSPHAEE